MHGAGDPSKSNNAPKVKRRMFAPEKLDATCRWCEIGSESGSVQNVSFGSSPHMCCRIRQLPSGIFCMAFK